MISQIDKENVKMTSEEIKLELFKRRREITMAGIARNLGVTRQAVQVVVDRRQTSQRIAAAVSAAIERPLEEVFPEMAECADRRRSACS